MKAKRLLFLVADDWYFWCHRLPLALAAQRAGYDVVVVTPPGEYQDLIQASGLRFVPIQLNRQGLNPLEDVATIGRLAALYMREKPDIVHQVALKPILYGTLAARIARVPSIVNAMPGMGYVFLSKQRLSRAIRPGVIAAFRALLNGANCRTILQNPDDLRAWVSRGALRSDRIVLIRGAGVDTTRFSPKPECEGAPLVILPARLLYDKGVAEFVAAAKALKARGVVARFALVGEGDAGNPASVPPEHVAAWVREGILESFGWRDDMEAVLAETSIVCLPSYGEGLPKALLEAASCGLPIVTTDVPGCREIVVDEENGLRVPPRDAVALAAALERLLRSPEERRRFGAAGRAKVLAEFSVESVAEQTLAVYRNLSPG